MNIPLSLYIHIPWCIQKCPYCDFNSHKTTGTIPEQVYINSLLEDLKQDCANLSPAPIQSIFIGGGTPGLFSGAMIGKLLDGIAQQLSFAANIEISLEANPGTVEQQRFIEYRAAGVNRLSIGVQSFNDHALKKLGRIHNSSAAKSAIITAKKAGFENINLDLMYGLPQQTNAAALKDLNTAIALQPTHLSWYQLTIEPNTVFYRSPPKLPDDDLIFEIEQQGRETLALAGFQQYEVSAYSQPNKQCQHNLNYWEFGDYLAIGAGAHAKYTNPQNMQIFRWQKVRQPNSYIDPKLDFIAKKQKLTEKDIIFEFMLNTLRLNKAITKTLFTTRTGVSWEKLTPFLEQAQNNQWIKYDINQLTVTEIGQLWINEIQKLFIY